MRRDQSIIFFFQAEDGIRDYKVTGVQTCALPIYGIAIRQVIAVEGETFSTEAWADWYGDKQRAVCIESGELDGLPHAAAVDKLAELLAAKGLGEKKTTWRLRDWGVSRQRYWGTPIPIIHCEDCGAQPVPAKDLPVVLPQDLVPEDRKSVV